MRLVDHHFPCHYKYYKLFNRNNIKLSYSCMPNMNNVNQKHSKIMKNSAPSTTKTCKQTVLWMVTVFLNALFSKHLLVQLLINITMVLVKILSKNVTEHWIIRVRMGIETKILVILLIGILLGNRRKLFVDLESVIYVFVSSSLFQEQILMFCSINVVSLSQNVRIEINLLWSVLKIDKMIYTIQCM